MNPRPNPTIRFSNLLAPATIALLVACAMVAMPQALATGKPKPKQGSAHNQGSAHSQIILQHHTHAKGAHSDIILQHHHH